MIGPSRVGLAVVLIGSLAVSGCPGDRCGPEIGIASSTCSSPPNGPPVAGAWVLDAVMYTGATCTGAMSLSGPDTKLSGSLTLNSPCLTNINGVVDAAAYGWNGTRGTFDGVLYSSTDATQRLLENGEYTADLISFTIRTSPSGDSIGSVTGHR